MIEFDVDMGYLLEAGELDCVILNDENGEYEPMKFTSELGSGTCSVKKGDGFTAGWWVCQSCNTLFDMVGALACSGKEKPNYCPGCGKKVVG